VPPDAKSYRVTMDRAGRWHIAFAVIPAPVPAPGNGQTVGIDRGVAVSAALSTGQMLHAPALTARERTRLRRLQRKLARAKRGSNRRGRVKHAIARLRARESDRRTDWAEQASTGIARRFDVIRVEDLQITNMTRSAKGTWENPGRNVRAKAGLNRGILGSGWGLLVSRLEDKAPGRVSRVEECRHRLGEVAQGLLLHRLGAGRQPRVPGPCLGELPALLQVARRARPACAPVGVLLDGQVPYVPGMGAVVPQHRFLGGRGEQPVPGHANIVAIITDIFRGGEVAYRAGLKAGACTPRS